MRLIKADRPGNLFYMAKKSPGNDCNSKLLYAEIKKFNIFCNENILKIILSVK